MKFYYNGGSNNFTVAKENLVWEEVRDKQAVKYKFIDQTESETVIGNRYIIDIDFRGITETEKDNLNTFFLDDDLLKVDNSDEVSSGSVTYSGDPLILSPKSAMRWKRVVNYRDINFYNGKMQITFSTKT